MRRQSTIGGVTADHVLDGQSVERDLQTINGALGPVATYLTGPTGPMYLRDDVARQHPVVRV